MFCIFLENIQFGLTMPFEIVESNDNRFIELKEFFYWYDTKDYAQYKLDNLYYGNKEQSKFFCCIDILSKSLVRLILIYITDILDDL